MRLNSAVSLVEIPLCLLAFLAAAPSLRAQQQQQQAQQQQAQQQQAQQQQAQQQQAQQQQAQQQQPQQTQRLAPSPRGDSARPAPDRGPGVKAAQPPPRGAPGQNPQPVERANHGDIRHADSHDAERPPGPPRDFNAGQHVIVHRDVDVDIRRQQFWHGFVYGARHRGLRTGCSQIYVGSTAYYYDSGIYYQQAGSEYQEVYPPLGAVVATLPDGAVELIVGNLTYYYAAGAFYARQPGGFAIAAPPMGAMVQELPPGAEQTLVNGGAAYRFNGVYYRPAFVNGATFFITFSP